MQKSYADCAIHIVCIFGLTEEVFSQTLVGCYGKTHQTMGTFTKYKIVDNDLFLTENMYCQFEPFRQDAIKDWKLSNVDKKDISKEKLEKLISYDEDCDIEEEQIANRKRLLISTYFDSAEYNFHCDNIYQELRPFDVSELTDIILRQEKSWSEQHTTIYKQKTFIDEVKSFIDREIETKSKIVEQVSDKTNNASIKAQHYLEGLTKIKNIINSKSI